MIERTPYTNWLDVCWDECEKMWEYVVKDYRSFSAKDHLFYVRDSKMRWLKANGYYIGNMNNNCFFCEYSRGDCLKCPGRLVDVYFNCINIDYHYAEKPIAFYKKIAALNKERKEQAWLND